MSASCNPTLENVSVQVQTTLSVVEEERDRFMAKLLGEEKNRKSLEGDPAHFKTLCEKEAK